MRPISRLRFAFTSRAPLRAWISPAGLRHPFFRTEDVHLGQVAGLQQQPRDAELLLRDAHRLRRHLERRLRLQRLDVGLAHFQRQVFLCLVEVRFRRIYLRGVALLRRRAQTCKMVCSTATSSRLRLRGRTVTFSFFLGKLRTGPRTTCEPMSGGPGEGRLGLVRRGEGGVPLFARRLQGRVLLQRCRERPREGDPLLGPAGPAITPMVTNATAARLAAAPSGLSPGGRARAGAAGAQGSGLRALCTARVRGNHFVQDPSETLLAFNR